MKPAVATSADVKQAELLISRLLRYGVLSSLSVVVLGLVVSYVQHPELLKLGSSLGLDQSAHGGDPLGGVFAELREGRGGAIVAVGLLLLVATPVTRVALSLVLFARMDDRRFVAITALVLSLLVLSFWLGTAG